MGISRRSFLKTSAALVGMVAGGTKASKSYASDDMAASTEEPFSTSNQPVESCDVLVVGGGISGIYSAWKLAELRPTWKIKVLEQADYIGGRLLSVTPPGIGTMTAELGGMRYIDNLHPLITRLVSKLNIPTYEFPADPQLYYLRGRYLHPLDFQSGNSIPYSLSPREQKKDPHKLILQALEQIVPGIKSMAADKRRTYCQGVKFDGRELYEQGFWNVLTRVLSSEAYHLVQDAGGYESIISNWNAADAIPWYLDDFKEKTVYRGFRNGFQEVPKRMAYELQQLHHDIQINTRVESFSWKPSGKLFVVDAFHTCGKASDKKVIECKRLILAMPRRALEILSEKSALLRQDKILSDIQSVTPRPLFKLYTTYKQPWWAEEGLFSPDPNSRLVKGRFITDLPVRQTYYWLQRDGSPKTEGPCMLMASYGDGINTGYWDGLREHGMECSDKVGWEKYKAPSAMLEEVKRQLATIHGLNYVPNQEDHCYKYWGDDPFGGGWNTWNIGVKSGEVIERMIQPHARLPLYICGEAYSNGQGWVEGALETAERVLERIPYFKIES